MSGTEDAGGRKGKERRSCVRSAGRKKGNDRELIKGDSQVFFPVSESM